MRFKFFNSALSLGLLLLFVSVNLAYAANQKQVNKLITLPEVQQKTQAIKDRQNLPEELKARILASYYESEDNLNELLSQETQAEAFKQSLSSLPLEAKKLQRQISEAENNLKNRSQAKFSLFPTDELEQRLIMEKSKLSDIDAEISRTEGQISDLSNRPLVIRGKIAEIKNKQTATQQELQVIASKTSDNLVEKEARQILLDTQVRLLNANLKALELENIRNPMQLQLQKDQLHLLNIKREQLNLLISDLDSYLLERRQQEIDKEQAALLQAQHDAEGKHPLIRSVTKENIAFNHSLQDVNKSMEQFLIQKNEIEVRYKQLERDYQSAEQKITLAGLSPVLGNLLREQRRNLPQRSQFSSLNDEIQTEIAKASLELFKLDEAKKQLSDINQTLLDRFDQELQANLDDSERLRMRTELRMLLNDQKDLVVRLSGAYAEYSQVLGDVDFNLQQMLSSADKFGAYLDERLLWVPSAPVISDHYLKDSFHSLLWLVSPVNWLKVGGNLWQGLTAYPLVLSVILAIVGLHWHFRQIIKANLLNRLQKSSNNPYAISFSQIIHGLGEVLLLTLPTPLMMLWVAWVLGLSRGADRFTQAIVDGLLAAAVSFCVVQFFYRVFKPGGVAELLFLWEHRTVELLFGQLKWSRFVVVPCIFIVAMTGNDLFSEHSYALGRTALIVMMLALAYVLHRLCHPERGLAKSFYRFSHGWVSRLGYLWYAIAVLGPLVIIGFAVAGYYQSALELQDKLITTLRLFVGTALFHALALRWLAVTKRQLALQNARNKRKQADQPATVEGVHLVDENLHDLSKINQQSNKLLTTVITAILAVGFWMIWSEILPAFSVFERIELWQHTQMLEGKEVLQPITLINLLICLLYAGLALVFVSNFPALVDLLSVGKYAMTAGSRYALIQLVRYMLVSIAFLAIANELGGSWSQVQWLVAALSVGLGFGLQEIFANMVSGIILLFERPIRVGDTVTVGDVTGRVSHIQMRATHIVDWDRKELIVPNKTFITDQLINWTLSDTVTRVVLPIGVAYGVDADLVEELLKETVKNTELVLHDPEPTVNFVGFGESSLNFKVNVYVRDLSDRVPVTNQLHKAIYMALVRNHIEIPYPQRDVHIRSVADGILPTK